MRQSRSWAAAAGRAKRSVVEHTLLLVAPSMLSSRARSLALSPLRPPNRPAQRLTSLSVTIASLIRSANGGCADGLRGLAAFFVGVDIVVLERLTRRLCCVWWWAKRVKSSIELGSTRFWLCGAGLAARKSFYRATPPLELERATGGRVEFKVSRSSPTETRSRLRKLIYLFVNCTRNCAGGLKGEGAARSRFFEAPPRPPPPPPPHRRRRSPGGILHT